MASSSTSVVASGSTAVAGAAGRWSRVAGHWSYLGDHDPQPAPKPTDGSLERLLKDIPQDIVFEVLSQLPALDLINLARTARVFRNLLLSRSGRSIWICVRKRASLPDLKELGMDELQYAVFVNLRRCGNCGKSSDYWPSKSKLLLRLCYQCQREFLVYINKLDVYGANDKERTTRFQKDLRKYHESAYLVVPTDEFSFRVDHLEAASAKLQELENEDLIETKYRRHCRMGKRVQAVKNEWLNNLDLKAPHTNRVKGYVEERKRWIKKCEREAAVVFGEASWNDIHGNSRDIEANAREVSLRQKLHRDIEGKTADLGWSIEQTQDYICFNHNILLYRGPTQYGHSYSLPADDAEWARELETVARAASHREASREEFESRIKTLQTERTNLLNQDALRPFYNDWIRLRSAVKSEAGARFVASAPDFNTFVVLPPVKRLWEGASSPVSPTTWYKAVSSINHAVEDIWSSARIKAIRLLLAADSREDWNTLSKKPSDYPEEVYDQRWFDRIDRHFFLTPGNDIYGHRDGELVAVPFPAIIAASRKRYEGALKFHFGMSYQHRLIIRALVEAAGLDVETATTEDLDDVGRQFYWEDLNPRNPKYHVKHTWRELMEFILERHPPKGSNLCNPYIRSAEGLTWGEDDKLNAELKLLYWPGHRQ